MARGLSPLALLRLRSRLRFFCSEQDCWDWARGAGASSWLSLSITKNFFRAEPGVQARLFFGAPGRAHSLGGESPLHTRQGEVLAEQQGCPTRGGIRRKLEAKRCSDEQPADMRRRSGVSRPIDAKPD